MAIEFVLAHPERVHTLVLAATHCGVSTSSTRPGTPCPRASLGGRSTRPASPTSRTRRRGPPHRSRQPRHPQGGRRQWEAMQAFDAHDRLPAIEVPTLVLHGTEDRMVASENAELIALASRAPSSCSSTARGTCTTPSAPRKPTTRCSTSSAGIADEWRPGARGARDRRAASRGPSGQGLRDGRCAPRTNSPRPVGPSSTTSTVSGTSIRWWTPVRRAPSGRQTCRRCSMRRRRRERALGRRGPGPTMSRDRSRRSGSTKGDVACATWSPT